MTIESNSLISTFCRSCIHPQHHEGCGNTFRSLLIPTICPDTLVSSHAVCDYCLDVYPVDIKHHKQCLFVNHSLKLKAIGWSTPESKAILRSMRRVGFEFYEPLANLLGSFLQKLDVHDSLLVPVPMASPGRRDLWAHIIDKVAGSLPNVQSIPILIREKHRSTRKSQAQTRRNIVQDEYGVNEPNAHLIENQCIVIIDDNVTTGITLTHCANLIQQYRPSTILTVAIERHISPRILQRCPVISDIICPHYIKRN